VIVERASNVTYGSLEMTLIIGRVLVEVLTVYAALRNGKRLGAELPRASLASPECGRIPLELPCQEASRVRARLDVVPADVTLLLPLQDGLTRKFGAIVGNAAHRLPVARD
jgi:hypothetical protein